MYNKISAIYEKYNKEDNFSGAGLVKLGDEVIFAEAYGYAHRGFKVKNKIVTKFDTASVTKLFTTVAILQLVDKHLLKLDDKITDIVDLVGTKIPEDVTIFHLLTHTSGIADDADEEAGESYADLFINKPNYSIRKCIDFLPQFAYKEPNFKAGTNVRYNNCAYVLLGLAIEKLTGEIYGEYAVKNIFNACGMNNTGFFAKDDSDADIAEGYFAIHDEKDNVIGWRKNIYSYPPVGTADGGAFTTVVDLGIFMRALVKGRLLSQEMTKEIMKPQVEFEQRYHFGKLINGFGFNFKFDNEGRLIRMAKEGVNEGVAAMFAYYPEIDATSVVLANQTSNVWKLNKEIEDELLKNYL
jgi:CubicO group peptidase (beta-lactamase class C family)